jgi:hypothetical protein
MKFTLYLFWKFSAYWIKGNVLPKIVLPIQATNNF